MRVWLWGLFLLAVTGLGCLQSRVTTLIDVRTFLKEDVIARTYVVPPNVPAIEVRTNPAQVVVSDRLRNSGELEAVGADLEVVYRHERGAADAALAFYVGDTPATVYDAPPLLKVDVELVPDTERTLARRLSADRRLLDLVRDNRLYFGFAFRWTPAGDDSIQGHYEITGLHLQVTSLLGGLLSSAEPKVPGPAPQ